jgi:uncharacterized protein YybS (DUF2232 family)
MIGLGSYFIQKTTTSDCIAFHQLQTGPLYLSLHSSCGFIHFFGTSSQVIATIIYIIIIISFIHTS